MAAPATTSVRATRPNHTLVDEPDGDPSSDASDASIADAPADCDGLD